MVWNRYGCRVVVEHSEGQRLGELPPNAFENGAEIGLMSVEGKMRYGYAEVERVVATVKTRNLRPRHFRAIFEQPHDDGDPQVRDEESGRSDSESLLQSGLSRSRRLEVRLSHSATARARRRTGAHAGNSGRPIWFRSNQGIGLCLACSNPQVSPPPTAERPVARKARPHATRRTTARATQPSTT